MSHFFDLIFNWNFYRSVILLSTPLLFATMSAVVCERAGVLNIGIEGTMLFSALMGVIGSAYSGSAFVGVLAAAVGGIAFSALLAFFYLKMGTNIVLTGIALNMLSSGLTIFILYVLTGDKGVSTSLASKTIPSVTIPGISSVPVLGELISGHNLMTYIAVLLVIALSVFMYKTKLGKYIRAAGENEESVATAGISVFRIRLTALLISGGLAGLGGAFMSMAYVSMFTKDMVAGRGFIALAAEAMGHGDPLLSALGALMFGVADALSNNLQILNIPSELLRMIPYLFTVIVLAAYAVREKKRRK